MQFFFHNSIKKYIIGMLHIFNSTITQKSDGRENTVPIYFASQERLNRALAIQNTSNKGGISLPVMALELVSMLYDTTRKTSKLNKIPLELDTSAGTGTSIYNSVPYNFDFSLFIKSRTITDLFQIVEQILPRFNPTISINIKEFTGVVEEVSVPITLNSVDIDFDTQLDEDGTQRYISGNLLFTMKAWIHFPINSSEAIIKKIYDSYGIESSLEDKYILQEKVI